jgi:hypothetical protein
MLAAGGDVGVARDAEEMLGLLDAWVGHTAGAAFGVRMCDSNAPSAKGSRQPSAITTEKNVYPTLRGRPPSRRYPSLFPVNNACRHRWRRFFSVSALNLSQQAHQLPERQQNILTFSGLLDLRQ